MKIFIFGSNGMLGNYMKSYLSKAYEIIELTRNDYDLSRIKIESLSELLKGFLYCGSSFKQLKAKLTLESKFSCACLISHFLVCAMCGVQKRRTRALRMLARFARCWLPRALKPP